METCCDYYISVKELTILLGADHVEYCIPCLLGNFCPGSQSHRKDDSNRPFSSRIGHVFTFLSRSRCMFIQPGWLMLSLSTYFKTDELHQEMLDDAQKKLMNLVSSTEGKVDKWALPLDFLLTHRNCFQRTAELQQMFTRDHISKKQFAFLI